MDTLPNEILLNILTHLPQRYTVAICATVSKKWNLLINQPSFYSTIHIYSEGYLEQFIQFAKDKKTKNDKPFVYFIKRIIFHYIQQKYHLKELSIFPNLQSIDGLIDDYTSAIFYNYVYLHLHRPTDFTYNNHNKEWIIKFNSIKNNLRSLKVYITNNLFDYTLQQQEQEEYHPIQLISMGMKEIDTANLQSVHSSLKHIKMLFLSTKDSLVYLTNLYIDFNWKQDIGYVINEYTFENIHQACPSLESLSLEDFYMDMIDYENNNNRYNKVYDKKPNEPVHRLKTLNINFSEFGDPRCFSYFGNKYPNIESLSFDIWYQDIDIHQVPIFEKAIINMLLQFPLLKKIAFLPNIHNGEHSWLHTLLMEWLYQHPSRLIHLDCIYDSVTDGSVNKRILSNNIVNSITNSIVLENSLQLQQLLINSTPALLNHLTSLSVIISNAVLFATTYLLRNKNTMVVSNVLKHLNIDGFLYSGRKHTYFYDWLDIFPNLTSLKLKNFGKVIDNEYDIKNDDEFIAHDGDDNDDYYLNKEDYQNIHKLHQLIKQRRKQQWQHSILNKEKESSFYYPLESLELRYCQNWYHNGINDFFKRCLQLKRLKLTNTTLIDRSNAKDKDVYFDLSHLHLEFFYIKNLSYTRNYNGHSRCFENIFLYKSLTDSKCCIPNSKCKKDADDNFELHIKCKYMDGFVFVS